MYHLQILALLHVESAGATRHNIRLGTLRQMEMVLAKEVTEWAAPDPDIIASELRRLAQSAAHQEAIAAIRPGRLRRDLQDRTYAARSLYTRTLRRYVYNPQVFDTVLTFPWLKTLFFQSFGYRGSTDFTIYPNCWIRDIPLLDIGSRAYLADGIVLGSNQVSVDQDWLKVDRIIIGARTVFDQQCMVGYGSSIAEDCIIGVRVAIGMNTRLGHQTRVGPASAIGHHCRIGSGAILGNAVNVGNFSRIDDGVKVPDYTNIPQFSHLSLEGMRPRTYRNDI